MRHRGGALACDLKRHMKISLFICHITIVPNLKRPEQYLFRFPFLFSKIIISFTLNNTLGHRDDCRPIYRCPYVHMPDSSGRQRSRHLLSRSWISCFPVDGLTPFDLLVDLWLFRSPPHVQLRVRVKMSTAAPAQRTQAGAQRSNAVASSHGSDPRRTCCSPLRARACSAAQHWVRAHRASQLPWILAAAWILSFLCLLIEMIFYSPQHPSTKAGAAD